MKRMRDVREHVLETQYEDYLKDVDKLCSLKKEVEKRGEDDVDAELRIEVARAVLTFEKKLLALDKAQRES